MSERTKTGQTGKGDGGQPESGKPEERRSEEGLFNGTRKLIRPKLPANFIRKPAPRPVELMHHAPAAADAGEGQNPEVQYFSKQIQHATEMTAVLLDGEELTGVIEWFDSNAFKMRLTTRESVMVYKAALKYLYKTSEISHSTLLP
jgi:sRNA-binding regulator protein Hfq